MSPDTWQRMIRPGEQREYDMVHSYGKDVWIHSCGNVERIIPSLIEMGVDVLNPVQPEAWTSGTVEGELRRPSHLLGRHQHAADVAQRHAR